MKPTTLVTLSLTLVSFAAAQSSCDCWSTHTGAVFTNRMWLDFRNVPVPSDSPIAPTEAPNPITAPAPETVQPGFLTSPEFTDSFWVESWGRPGLSYSRGNVYIAADTSGEGSSTLVLRTRKNPGFQTAAEISSRQRMLHGSFRVRTRVSGAAGACAGIFTYQSDVQESDIEILTKDAPQLLQFTNHPSQVSGAYTPYDLAQLAGGMQWDQWRTHRLDWTDGMTTFMMDGITLVEKTVNVPTEQSSFMINMWSDGGAWTGTMEDGGEANMEVAWVEALYNNTESTGRMCNSICNIDK